MTKHITLAAACLLAAACTAPASPGTAPAPAPASAAAADANQQLDQLAEAFFEAGLALNPTAATSIGDTRYNHLYTAGFMPEVRERGRALRAEYEPRLLAIDRNALDAEHQLTYEIFRRNLEEARLSERFPGHVMPLNQFFNWTAGFVQMGTGTGIHPFRTVKDYDDFLSRIRGFEGAVDASIATMREGMRTGIVQPRVLME
ncbi:MAG TPA: DUF885 family protein, partial [Longimicrobium sp.]|nr:DUF885 family protein [Longimicrobium sp.]